MTRETIALLAHIEGALCVARTDARTLLLGAERNNYFADVAKYNVENIEQLSVYVRSLIEELQGNYRNIEECPFLSEEVPF